ncbi:MAG: twin-arginine translocation signal domain-containing protein [Planctomycetes bacterium]|nr:twin-arginine translocation signal domain-containing protein [Planctomycetota bacterium]
MQDFDRRKFLKTVGISAVTAGLAAYKHKERRTI